MIYKKPDYICFLFASISQTKTGKTADRVRKPQDVPAVRWTSNQRHRLDSEPVRFFHPPWSMAQPLVNPPPPHHRCPRPAPVCPCLRALPWPASKHCMNVSNRKLTWAHRQAASYDRGVLVTSWIRRGREERRRRAVKGQREVSEQRRERKGGGGVGRWREKM